MGRGKRRVGAHTSAVATAAATAAVEIYDDEETLTLVHLDGCGQGASFGYAEFRALEAVTCACGQELPTYAMLLEVVDGDLQELEALAVAGDELAAETLACDRAYRQRLVGAAAA